MGRMSRQKGKRGEREAAAELGAILNVEARRGVQYQGGPGSPDVVLEGVNIHVEAKRTERLALWAALEQAKADAPEGSVPIVWHKANRRASVVILETDRLWDLCHTLWMSRRWRRGEEVDSDAREYAPQNATPATVAGGRTGPPGVVDGSDRPRAALK